MADQFKRDTFEKVVFYATAQICIIYFISLMIAAYNLIVITMQREKYVHVTDEGEMELGENDYDDPVPNDGTPSTPLETAIVFRTPADLNTYVFITHKMGVLLFVLIIAMDYSHSWMTYVFVFGLSVRFIAGNLHIVREKFCETALRIWTIIIIIVSYTWLGYLTSFPGFVVSGQSYPITSPLIMLVMFCAGFEWAQTSGFQGRPITQICYDSKCTILFMSVPAFIILYRADLFTNYHPKLQDVVIVWVVQPTVKFLCVVIFVMSIRAGRAIELIFVNTITLFFDMILMLPQDNETIHTRAICGMMISIIVGAYVVRVVSVSNEVSNA